MSTLRNIKEHVQAVRQNKGILKTDQIELVGTTTTPADANLTDGRIYYNSTSNILYARINSSWQNLASAGTSGISGWDSIYALDQALTMDGNTITITVSADVAAFTFDKTGTGAGNVLDITNAGTGKDIDGTSSTWHITKAGVFTGTKFILGDGESIVFGATSDASIEWDNANSYFAITGATNITGALTTTSTAVLAGTAGSDSLTLTAGDVEISDGAVAITDADNASTIVIVNATLTAGADAMSATFAALTTKSALLITADAITSGNMLDLDAGGDTMTTGYYINCNDDDTADFTVGADGATIITGTVNSTTGLIVVGVQTSKNTVEITSSGVTANDYASLQINPSGNIAAGGCALRIAPSGTPVTGSIAIEVAGSTKVMQGLVIDVDETSNHAVDINCGGAFETDKAVLYVSADGTPQTNASVARFQFEGTATNNPTILNVYGTGKDVRGILVDTDNTDIHAVGITGTGNLTGANMLYVDCDGTPVANTDSIVKFAFTGTSAEQHRILEIYGTGKDVGGIYVDTDCATTSHAVSITGSGALNGINMLYVNNDDTPVAYTDSVVKFSFTGTATEEPRILDIYGTGKAVGGIYVDVDNITTSHAVSITGTGNITTARMLYVTNDGIPTLATSAVAEIAFSGTDTNKPRILMLNGAGKDVQGLWIDADPTASDAVYIHSDAVIANNKAVVNIHQATGAMASGSSLLRLECDSTPAATVWMQEIDMTGIADTNDPGGLWISGAGKGVKGIFVDVDNVTTHAVQIDGSGALAAGNMLLVDNDGVPAANTDAVVNFTFTGTATNNPIVLEVDNSTKDAQPLQVTSNVASATRTVATFDQASTTGAKDVIELDQADVDKSFILFTGTMAGANHITAVDKSGGAAYYVLVNINSSPVYIKVTAGA